MYWCVHVLSVVLIALTVLVRPESWKRKKAEEEEKKKKNAETKKEK
jgi:hypothetical protein